MTVTIADAKDHSRVLHDDDDLLIQRLIDGAAVGPSLAGVASGVAAPSVWLTFKKCNGVRVR